MNFNFFLLLNGYSGKTRANRFWRKRQNACGKWSLHHVTLEQLARKGTQQKIVPLSAKGKIRQKLINGLYESFCYSPRHALDFRPNNSDELQGTPLTVTIERHPSPERYYPSRICENLTTIDQDDAVNENLLASSNWHRANSWSTSASCAYSSGYSSANTSCPSSANSHRSTSPTPDFSNIKLLSATLEDYNGENNSFSEDGGLGIGTDDVDLGDEYLTEPCDFFATWPQKNRMQDKQRVNKRIFSGKLCLHVYRSHWNFAFCQGHLRKRGFFRGKFNWRTRKAGVYAILAVSTCFSLSLSNMTKLKYWVSATIQARNSLILNAKLRWSLCWQKK